MQVTARDTVQVRSIRPGGWLPEIYILGLSGVQFTYEPTEGMRYGQSYDFERNGARAELSVADSDVELNVVKFVCTAREQPENSQMENRCVWARALLCTIEWPGKTLRASANTTDWGWRWRERACERLTLSCQKYPSLNVYFDMKRTWEGAICIDQASYFGFYAGVTGGPPGCHLLVPGTEGTFPVYTTDDELEDNDSRSSTPDMNHDV